MYGISYENIFSQKYSYKLGYLKLKNVFSGN